MAKTIKFNLILDDYPVRNIEGLQNHFSIEDVLKYFDNGLLLRWLDVRGYESQRDAVQAIDKSLDRKAILVELVKIFEVVDLEEPEIEKEIAILSYLEEENAENLLYKECAYEKKRVIDGYHSGYEALIFHMIENKENMAVLKADAFQLEREYFGLFELNHYELFFSLIEFAPKAIFAILTREIFKEFWIGEKANRKIHERMVRAILNAIEILGEDVKVVMRNTQAMWDPIERPEVKVMVISIEYGTFIKNAGEFSEKLGSADVNNKLLTFNGLEYQCNDEFKKLVYMEV